MICLLLNMAEKSVLLFFNHFLNIESE